MGCCPIPESIKPIRALKCTQLTFCYLTIVYYEFFLRSLFFSFVKFYHIHLRKGWRTWIYLCPSVAGKDPCGQAKSLLPEGHVHGWQAGTTHTSEGKNESFTHAHWFQLKIKTELCIQREQRGSQTLLRCLFLHNRMWNLTNIWNKPKRNLLNQNLICKER